MAERFKDKVVIVTGASKGIGRACAEAFAREGGKVAIADISVPDGQEVVERIKEEGGEAIFVNCDVSKAQDVQRLVADTIRAFGGIDVLHSNAGVQRYGTVVDMSEELWDWIIGVNLKGAFLTCKYAIPEMRKRSGGAIVISSSVQGLASQRSVVAYAASKAGLISLTRTVALDHASENIRCNSVAPGTIHTPLLEWGANLAAPDDPEGIIVEWGKLHPIGRIGKPEEVANLVLFLASDEASFCTGGTYLIDGGLLSLLN